MREGWAEVWSTVDAQQRCTVRACQQTWSASARPSSACEKGGQTYEALLMLSRRAPVNRRDQLQCGHFRHARREG
eukprot:7663654-Karenia_brevis.AAC.1